MKHEYTKDEIISHYIIHSLQESEFASNHGYFLCNFIIEKYNVLQHHFNSYLLRENILKDVSVIDYLFVDQDELDEGHEVYVAPIESIFCFRLMVLEDFLTKQGIK